MNCRRLDGLPLAIELAAARLAALLSALPLSNSIMLAQWQQRARDYPPALGVKMVRTHLRFRSSSEHRTWAERHELLLLYQSFCTAQKQLLLALLGLNHVYYPGLARLDRLMERLPLAPVYLAARCQQIFGIAGVDPLAGVYQLHDLIEETFALVETHLPEIDTRRARTRFDPDLRTSEHMT